MFTAAVRRLLSALAAILVLATAATAATVLNRGNDGDPETLDPHKTSTVAEANILRDMFEGLLVHDMAGQVAPGVATTWTISPDGLTYTFKLRPDARWSNGDPVGAGDFVYAIRRLLDPDTGAKYANILYPIRNAESFNKKQGKTAADVGITAPDPATVVITLEQPTPYLLELLTHQTALPVHRASIERLGRDWVKPGNLVSNGAYALVSYVPNSEIVLRRNTNFHAASKVAIDEVRYIPTPDFSVAARRFMAGELQMTSDIPADQVGFLRERLGSQVNIAPYLGTLFLMINAKKPPFTDLRVRRALALAIDRDFIATEIWGGTMLPATGFIPPGVSNYTTPGATFDFANLAPYEREDEAKRLLAEAGFGPAKPLKLELRYNITDNNRRMAVAIADQWKQIGVVTTFVSTDGKTHFAHLRDGGDFDVARYGWIADYSDPQNFLFLLKSDNTGFNAGRYASPEFDGLLDKAARQGDLTARAETMRAAERKVLVDMPWIPVLFYSTKSLISPKVKGFTPNTRGAYATRYLSLAP